MKYFLVPPEEEGEDKPLKDLVLHSPVQAEIPVVLCGDNMTFLTGERKVANLLKSWRSLSTTSDSWLSNIFLQFCIPKSHFSMLHFLPLLKCLFLLFRILTRYIFMYNFLNIFAPFTWHTYLLGSSFSRSPLDGILGCAAIKFMLFSFLQKLNSFYT